MHVPIDCKRCGWEWCTKNGKVRNNQQRYKCPRCKLNFVEGDKRVNNYRDLRNVLANFFENSREVNRDAIRQYLKISVSLRDRELKKYRKERSSSRSYQPPKETLGLAFQDVLSYVEKQMAFLGGSKRWIAAHGEILPGYEAIVILRPTRQKAETACTEPVTS